MAEQVFDDCSLFLAGYDLSGQMNALGLRYAADVRDVTTFGQSTRKNVGALKTVSVQHEGQWEGGDAGVDKVLFDRIGADGELMTISPDAAAAGDVAYFFKSTLAAYEPGAEIGDVLRFSVAAEANDDLVRGTVAVNASAIAASGAAAAQNLGAVSSSQKLYAGLHILAASGTGPTLDVTIESDATNSFGGGETTRVTFAQAGAIGAQWATPVSGAITDGWWRVAYAVGGTSPSFSFLVSIGIQ